jgi:hypothetical protein
MERKGTAMFYQLTASEWRTLRRLHLAGGKANWVEIRPFSRRAIVAHVQAVLLWLRLIQMDGEVCRLTDQGKLVQELGELEIAPKELRNRPRRCETLSEANGVAGMLFGTPPR